MESIAFVAQTYRQMGYTASETIENRPAFKNALIKGQWSASTFNTYWTIAW